MKLERNAASGSRRADGGDAVEEAVAVAPAAHAAQQRARHVLEREVEVRHAGGADGVDQRVGEVGRVQVEQPDPVDPGRHGLRPAATIARSPWPWSRPKDGEVLGDEHDLA